MLSKLIQKHKLIIVTLALVLSTILLKRISYSFIFPILFFLGFSNKKDIHIDYMHYLMHLYITIPKAQRYECNFTSYHRPAKFTKRESGKIILFAVASLLLAFIYPISYWAFTYTQSLQNKLLHEEYRHIHEIKITREATININRAQKEIGGIRGG